MLWIIAYITSVAYHGFNIYLKIDKFFVFQDMRYV